MTAADDARPGPRPVDLDLLADYLAGELDRPAARRVEELVDREPRWAASLATLRRADGAVRDALAGLGGSTGPMPEDVFDRIMAALPSADATPATASPTANGTPGLTGSGPVGGAGTRPPGRPGRDAIGGPAGHAARRRTGGPGRRAWLAAAAVVAVVLLGAGAAIGLFHQTTMPSSTAGVNADAKQGAPEVTPPSLRYPLGTPAAPGAVGGVKITVSGNDYSFGTMHTIEPPSVPGTYSAQGGGDLNGAPAALARLTDPAALAACLAQVTAAYGAVPASVDFAAYDGRPALVILLESAHRVVAVGPACGLPGSGTDEIATVPTG